MSKVNGAFIYNHTKFVHNPKVGAGETLVCTVTAALPETNILTSLVEIRVHPAYSKHCLTSTAALFLSGRRMFFMYRFRGAS